MRAGKDYVYAIGFVRGRNTKFLKTRETNLRRAAQALRKMLKGNTRYKKGVVAKIRLLNGVEASYTISYKAGKE